MKIKFGSIEVSVTEHFFYNPKVLVSNICKLCDRKDCPVKCKDIVNSCNSYKFITLVKDPETIQWRITNGLTMSTPGLSFYSTST